MLSSFYFFLWIYLGFSVGNFPFSLFLSFFSSFFSFFFFGKTVKDSV